MASSSQRKVVAYQRYEYEPLTEHNSIRLLAILPGHFEDAIRCTLSQVSLDDEPSYESLSYTWGSPNRDKSLICDGQALLITKNLNEGLRRLRRGKKVRVVWVDAVCVNQDDTEERNQQILLMTRIYKQAKQVVVWLGDSSDGQDLIKLPTKEREWSFNVDDRPPRKLPYSWLSHFNRPYFLRVWIIQEIAFARKITVIHGRQKIPWRDFEKIADEFEDRTGTTQLDPQLINSINMINSLDNYQDSFKQDGFDGFSAHALLDETAGCKATDLRDRIFALRGLLEPKYQSHIIPDYSASITTVLIDVAKAIVKVNEGLNILAMASPTFRRPGLPSWAPNFDDKGRRWGSSREERSRWHAWWWSDHEIERYAYNDVQNPKFDADNVPIVAVDDTKNILQLKGLRVARISFLHEMTLNVYDDTEFSYKAGLDCVHRWYGSVREDEYWGEKHLERFPMFIYNISRNFDHHAKVAEALKSCQHYFGGIAFRFKRAIFKSNHEFTPSTSTDSEKQRRILSKASKAIQGVAKFQKDPMAALKSVPHKMRPHLERKNVYPIVPATSDGDSNSVEGNVSSHGSISEGTSPALSRSFSSLSPSSDSDDPMYKRKWEKARWFTKGTIKRNVKPWTKFAAKQYRKGLGKESASPSSSSSSSHAEKNENIGEQSSTYAEPHDNATGPHVGKDQILEHAESSESTEDTDLSSRRSDFKSEHDLANLSPVSKESKSTNSLSPCRISVPGIGDPPYPSSWLEQAAISNPCACVSPDQIDHHNHLTPEEEAKIFSSSESAMLTPSVRRFLDFEIAFLVDNFLECISNMKFGFIRLEGVTMMGMFPLSAKEYDIVALIRGLRHPCLLREVGLGKYEWVGGCYLNTLWDWDFLETRCEKGGAGVENLEDIAIV